MVLLHCAACGEKLGIGPDGSHSCPPGTPRITRVQKADREELLRSLEQKAFSEPERDPNIQYPLVGTDSRGNVYTGELERFIAAYLTANPAHLKDLVNRVLDERISEENRKIYKKMFENHNEPFDFTD